MTISTVGQCKRKEDVCLTNNTKKIIPKCKDGNQSYFSASGRWLPCCSWPDEGKYLNDSIFARPEFLIKNSIDMKFWELDIFNLWMDKTEDNYESAYGICKHRCSSEAHEKQNLIKEMAWTMEEQHFIENDLDLLKFLESHDIKNEE